MARIEPSAVTTASRGIGSQQGGTVIWLAGEHDISTVGALTRAMAEVIAIDDADLVVDLSGVLFMGAAIVAVLARARDYLCVRSRSLTLRSPSARVTRVLERCGLADLVDPRAAEIVHAAGPAGALGTWVAVPATERADGARRQPEPKPAGLGRVAGLAEGPRKSHQRAEEHTTSVAGHLGA